MTNQEFFATQWHKEMKRNLVAIKALPTEMNTLNYKPSDKSRTAHEIIGHILPHAEELYNSISDGFVNEVQHTFESIDEAYNYHEKFSHLLVEKVKTVSTDDWENKMMELRANGRKLYEGKMMDMFWTLMFDTIHHRGQLTTYYRAMGMRNPSIYGPAAEDIEDMIAAAAAKNN